MNTIEDLIGMVMTEAAELPPDTPRKNTSNLEPILYNLELIENPDGTYSWVDD